jgi:tetrahydromethanopterin S-methyltransferase subunit A
MQAEGPDRVEMDKAGYFVILPQPTKGTNIVEHYSYDDKRLLRVVEGGEARALYWTLIKLGDDGLGDQVQEDWVHQAQRPGFM